tara:strand:+ start:62 stop:1111 length:1050 start_codon:yes stop_codon:yes gene_type:complete
MIKYLYTEKTYPSWLFKTSYFDLNLHSRQLKQHAVYQRDGEADVLEYIRETKPYHAKVREVRRVNNTSDIAKTLTTIDENLKITLDFGKASRYKKHGEIFDGGTTGNIPSNTTDNDVGSHGDLEQGEFLRNRTTATTVAGGIDTGEVSARAVESSVVIVQNFKDGASDADIHATDGNLTGFTLDKTEFYVYDVYGRGYNVPIKDWGLLADNWTITAGSFVVSREYTITKAGTTDFTLIGAADSNIGTKFTASGVGTGTGTARGPFILTSLQGTASAQELSASKKNTKLIAVQSISNPENVEFMMYDKNTSGTLNIMERALYTTVGHNFSQNDRIFVLDTPLALVLQDQK